VAVRILLLGGKVFENVQRENVADRNHHRRRVYIFLFFFVVRTLLGLVVVFLVLVLGVFLIVVAFLRTLTGFIQRIAGIFKGVTISLRHDRNECVVDPAKQVGVSLERLRNPVRSDANGEARTKQPRFNRFAVALGPELDQPFRRQAAIVPHRPFEQRINITVKLDQNDVRAANAHGDAGFLNLDFGRARLGVAS